MGADPAGRTDGLTKRRDAGRMAAWAAWVVAPALAAAACEGAWPEPPALEPAAFAAEHEEWRLERQASLVDPSGRGAVLWSGLWELPEGVVYFGADSSLQIVLPAEDSPPVAGALRRTGRRVVLEPADGVALRFRDGEAGGELVAGPTTLENDRSDSVTVLLLGSLGLRVHAERGTPRLWLRAWDRDSPKRDSFRLPPYYPVSGEWRFAARMDSYPEPRTFELADVTDGTVENVSPGELVFRTDGQERRLVAFATESSSNYFVMLWDSTATTETYQAGRYMRVPFPGEDGWTVIDFNRAYNPPCVFTPYSVCSLPPRESRLATAVSAGEKRPEAAPY